VRIRYDGTVRDRRLSSISEVQCVSTLLRRSHSPVTPEKPIHLVQLLIPLYDNERRPFPPTHYSQLRDELTREFGGLTAYTRAPAQGTWSAEDGEPAQRDDIVVYEVMVATLDRAWWADYRRTLEQRFEQDQLVVRSQLVEML
jgi:hypothetical protein